MVKDNQMLRVFPSPPMVAYRQARNSSLKSLLVKSKLPEKTRTRQNKNGMRKCNTVLPNLYICDRDNTC